MLGWVTKIVEQRNGRASGEGELRSHVDKKPIDEGELFQEKERGGVVHGCHRDTVRQKQKATSDSVPKSWDDCERTSYLGDGRGYAAWIHRGALPRLGGCF
jgi:hypothetical protein